MNPIVKEMDTGEIRPGDALKRCPYCCEFIRLDARVCRCCLRDIHVPEYRLTFFGWCLVILGTLFIVMKVC